MVRKRTKKLLKKLKANATAAKHAGKQLGAKSTVRDGVRVKFPQKPGRKTQAKRKRQEAQEASPAQAKAAKVTDTQSPLSNPADTPVMSMDEFLAGGFNELMDESKQSEGENGVIESDTDDEEADVINDENDENDENDVDEESDEEDEEAAHQRDLDALKETDPEFHKHLVENASELLNFKAPAAEEETKEEATVTKQLSSSPAETTTNILTSAKLSKLTTAAFEQKSSKALKQLLQAFKAGCHLGDDAKSAAKTPPKYQVVSPAVFQKLVISVLRKLHGWLRLKLRLSKLKDAELPSESKSFGAYERMIKSFLKALLHLISTSTDPTMLQFLMQSCRHYGIYFACFPSSLAKIYLKTLLKLWGTSEDEVVRIVAFLRIRQLAIEAKSSFLEKTIKGAYLTFVRNAKFSNNELVAGRIAMQAKCFVELCGIDLVVTYQNAFTYIRQLALHLRTALLAKSEETVQQVYSWQFLHCLKLWAAVLCAHAGEQQLRPLFYPFIQVVFGTIGLVPGPRYIPIRLHLVRLLNAVSRASKLYIPTSSVILDVFKSTSELLMSKPAPSTKKPPNMEYTLRFKKAELKTNACQSAVVEGCVELLQDHFECYRFSIGFPEMIHPSIIVLKSFSRKTRVSRWRSRIQGLLKQAEEWKQTILQKRKLANFGPTNVTRLEAFSSALEREVSLSKPVRIFDAKPLEEKQPEPSPVHSVEKKAKRKVPTVEVKQNADVVDGSGSEDVVEKLELSSDESEDEGQADAMVEVGEDDDSESDSS